MLKLNERYNKDSTTHPVGFSIGTDLYIALRHREQRIMNDAELLRLPKVSTGHVHYKEWQIRRRSTEKLLNFIRRKQSNIKILEVGCGNGWLSYRMSMIKNTDVTGLDINLVEVQQALRVFGDRGNLRFLTGDLRDGILADHKYDLVVFAASIQYFKSLPEIITTALQHLNEHGEIYITDSMFYTEEELAGAKARSAAYFDDLGFPGMSTFYFHHAISDLDFVPYEVLYKPGTLVNKLLRRDDPFYRILIKASRSETDNSTTGISWLKQIVLC